MTPQQMQFHCPHVPNYQKGCTPCSIRYVKFLRPSREKQVAYLSGLPAEVAQAVKEALRQEREA